MSRFLKINIPKLIGQELVTLIVTSTAETYFKLQPTQEKHASQSQNNMFLQRPLQTDVVLSPALRETDIQERKKGKEVGKAKRRKAQRGQKEKSNDLKSHAVQLCALITSGVLALDGHFLCDTSATYPSVCIINRNFFNYIKCSQK